MDLDKFKRYLKQFGNELPSLSFSDNDPSCSEKEWYLSYYGIDFSQQIPGVSHKMGGVEIDGYRVACHYWLPAGNPKATVLVIHGYFDHVGLYGHLIRYLLERDYAVVAFDLPGHGLSSGEQASIDRFLSYVMVTAGVVECLEALPKPLHAVGQSTGGAVLLKSLWVSPDAAARIDKMVLLAPLVRPVYWNKVKLLYWLLHKFQDSVPREFIVTCSNPAFLEFVAHRDPLQSQRIPVKWVGAMKKWIELFPTLSPLEKKIHLIQGDNDNTVDWRYNNRVIIEKLANTSLTLIPGAGHHLVNESTPLREQIFSAMPF